MDGTVCFEQLESFGVGRQQVTMSFDGGSMVSDAGVVADSATGPGTGDCGGDGAADSGSAVTVDVTDKSPRSTDASSVRLKSPMTFAHGRGVHATKRCPSDYCRSRQNSLRPAPAQMTAPPLPESAQPVPCPTVRADRSHNYRKPRAAPRLSPGRAPTISSAPKSHRPEWPGAQCRLQRVEGCR